MSTYVMSDIHGCYDDFSSMLKLIGFSGSDCLIVAGDLTPVRRAIFWEAFRTE